MKRVGTALGLASLGLLVGAIIRHVNRPGAAPTGPQLPARLTPMTRADAIAHLRLSLQSALARPPTSSEVAMLAAHSDVETGSWQHMHQWNFGNVTAVLEQPWYKLDGNPHHFRAYANPVDGAAGMVGLLARHYPEAVALLGSQNFLAYANALKEHGYFEEDPEGYARALQSRYEAQLAAMEEAPTGTHRMPS